MATTAELLEKLKGDMEEMGLQAHEGLLEAVIKSLGPSVHQKDASLVACSDDNELATIKKNFLIGKLGLNDGPELDNAIQTVCQTMGESNRNKHRAIFYYLLVGIFKKEGVFIETPGLPVG